MKKWIVFLILLTVLATASIYQRLPELIPAHFNWEGQVDRFGSKMELFLLPVLMVILSGIFLILRRSLQKTSEINAKICNQVLVVLLLLFTLLQGWMIHSIQSSSINIGSFLFLIFGGLFLYFGSVLKKVERNPWIGLRTKWSLSSDVVWKKSNEAVAKYSTLFGFFTLFIGFLLPVLQAFILFFSD